MNRIRTLTILALSFMMCLSSCNANSSTEQNSTDTTVTTTAEAETVQPEAQFPGVTIQGNFEKTLDPPLLKKVAMYNAGCINPLSNYDRDFDRITELNADALRIDLSIGKSGGTGGQYLIGKDYGIYDLDPVTGKYKIDVGSLQYDFSQLDSVVEHMTRLDVRPYMSWSYLPAPLQQDGKWHKMNENVENWQQVWEEMFYEYAKHYVDAGVQIGYHEIYNEPDLELLKCWGVFDEGFVGFLDWQDFCNGKACTPAKGVYPDMYVYGVKGILRADPFATVGGPAFALGDVGAEAWGGFLPRVKKEGVPLDFFSFHTYLDGNTWFMSDAERASGAKNELEKVVAGLSSDKHFINTAIHINEYSWLNGENGANDGLSSSFNYYRGAWMTMDAIMESVNRTSVQWIYWAQFMESTFGHDPYGLIEHEGGNIKAAFNAIKIYADMPVWRYDASLSKGDTGLKTLLSADEDKIAILIYNTNAEGSKKGDQEVQVLLEHAPFSQGLCRIYRIDGEHASYFDGTKSAELIASAEEWVDTTDRIWSGTVPADGMVYITVNKNGAADFTSYDRRTEFATDIKTSYYYEDRFRGLSGSRESFEDYEAGIVGSYAHYDRSTNTMYLGMGDALGIDGKFKGQAHASGAVIFTGLPGKFFVDIKTEGNLAMLDKNSTLGVRIDFYNDDTDTYIKSVYFCCKELYSDTRNPIAQDKKLKNLPDYPWGTQKAPDQVIFCSGSTWEIDLSLYAPEGWDAATDKAQISFDMQNTGAHTRAAITLRK